MKKKNRIIILAVILSLYTFSSAEESSIEGTDMTNDTTEELLEDESLGFASQSLSESTEPVLEITKEEASNKDHIFSGFEMNLGYVSKNMWAGFQYSEGPCIQSITKFSFWKFNVGGYWNMIGSEQDRIKKSTSAGDYKTDKAARGFGMVDEAQFFIEGGHTWKRLTIEGSIWLLAYSGDDSIVTIDTTINDIDSTVIRKYDVYNWWGKNTSAELTIRPSFQIGPVSIFTEQNVVIFALEKEKTTSTKDDSTGNVNSSTTSKGSSIGAYHGVIGATISKEMENISIGFTAKTEYAPFSFIEPNVWHKDDREKEPSGFYHFTLSADGSYTPLPPLTVSGFFNVQFMTNKDLDKAMKYKGCIPYGGLGLTYSWNRK